ncbi:MAG: hypothetical protein Q7R22_003155, partial [Verrucomicrobiota bacterium JB025]|nr:hypothetical protein [Verrucomicrobiota bacterium JB025]
GLVLARGPQFLDDLFRGMSFSFHDESQTRLAPGTLIADGSIFGEHSTAMAVTIVVLFCVFMVNLDFVLCR